MSQPESQRIEDPELAHEAANASVPHMDFAIAREKEAKWLDEHADRVQNAADEAHRSREYARDARDTAHAVALAVEQGVKVEPKAWRK